MPEMSIEELAHKAGLSRQTVGAIETGKNKKVALITLAAIAKALTVPLSSLIADVNHAMGVAEEKTQYHRKNPHVKHNQ